MDERNYLKVIEVLAETISKLQNDVFFKDYEIGCLKEKLAEAEKHNEKGV